MGGDTMQVELIRPVMYQGKNYARGDVLEIADNLLQPFLDGQYVKRLEAQGTSTKTKAVKKDSEGE